MTQLVTRSQTDMHLFQGWAFQSTGHQISKRDKSWRVKTLKTSVCPLPFSKGMQEITGEAGPFTLHVVVTLGQLFAVRRSWCVASKCLCKATARSSSPNTANEGTGALLHLPAGYSNKGADSTAAARTHSFGASCCVDACLRASLVSQWVKIPHCVVHKVILSCHLDTSYRISSGRH